MKSTKKKATRLNTEDFVDTNTIRINNWADEMEDEEPLPMNKPVLPSAPKSIRSGQDYDPKLLPQSAPFCASITNIHFEAKEDEIINMLAPIKVMRVDFNSDNGRFSGTAVIEFSTIEDLIQGLGAQKSIRGRPFYIQLPNPNGDFSGRHRDGGYSSRYGGTDNTSSNWRTNRSENTSSGYQRQEQIYPPPNNFGSGGGSSFNRGGGRYENDFSRQPRNEGFSNRGGGFGDRYDRNDDDRQMRRRNDDFTRGSDSIERNWSRDRPAPVVPSQIEDNNWRSAPRAPPRDDFSRDRRAPEPRQFNRERGDSFRGRDDFHRQNEEREFVRGPPPPQSGGDDLYNSQDYHSGGNGNVGGHYGRERTHSNTASHDDYDGNRSVKSIDEERRKPTTVESLVPVLKELLVEKDEDNSSVPESYNSIFGSAKPVDTRNRELEIERKLKKEAEEAAAAVAAAAAAAAALAAQNVDVVSESGETRNPAERFPRPDRNREVPPRMDRGVGGPRDGRKMNGGRMAGNRDYDDRGTRRDRYNDNPRAQFRDDRPRYNEGGMRGGDRRVGGGGGSYERRDGGGRRNFERDDGARVYRDREYRPNRDFNRNYGGNNEFVEENNARNNENYISNKYGHLSEHIE